MGLHKKNWFSEEVNAVEEVKEEAAQPSIEKELMDKLVMTLAIAEQKMDIQIDNVADEMAKEVAKVDSFGKSLRQEVEQLKDTKRIAGVESSINTLRKDLGDHQNKMKGVDELKPLCQEHDMMLRKMHNELHEMHGKLAALPALKESLRLAQKEISDLKEKLPKAESQLSVRIDDLRHRADARESLDEEKMRCMNNHILGYQEESKLEMEDLRIADAKMIEKLDGIASRAESIHQEANKRVDELSAEQRKKQADLKQEMRDLTDGFREDREMILDRLESLAFVSKKCDLVEKRVEKIFYDVKEVRIHLNI